MEAIKRTKIVDVLKSEAFGTTVNVKGWVRTRRGSKQVSFIALNDGSTINNVQIVVDVDKLGEEFLKPITTGASISVNGTLVQSQGKGQNVEIQATEIEIYGSADPNTYPLQKKGHSMEFLREIAHLRPRTNTFGAVFRIRHNMPYAIHKFFHDRGFFYFHTPLITASDCEGAGQMFQVTTMNLYDLKKDENGSIVYDNDFFGKQASLTVSGQLEGELAATALGQIYTFGPTFRAENSNTPRHLAEFWMIEPEVAFNDILDNMQLAEEFGIRKAIGATPFSILKLIIVESILITAVFGYLGMILGIGLTEGINSVMEMMNAGKNVSQDDMSIFLNPTVNLSVALSATALIIGAGVLAGYFPARKAVKITAIEAMRNE